MGRPDLSVTAVKRGEGLAPVTLQELYRHVIDTCARSGIVTGIEALVLEEPVLKLRAHLGAQAFIDIFSNIETRKTAFALIKNGQRIFGADNTRGWHLHPFSNPEAHHPCEEVPLEDFLKQTETHRDQWA